jgi:hypothetical protein
LSEVTRSGTDHLYPALDRVGLVNEAHLRLGSLGETYTHPAEEKANHTLAAQAPTTDPIYSVSSGSDSKYGRIVYMLEQTGEVPKKSIEKL